MCQHTARSTPVNEMDEISRESSLADTLPKGRPRPQSAAPTRKHSTIEELDLELLGFAAEKTHAPLTTTAVSSSSNSLPPLSSFVAPNRLQPLTPAADMPLRRPLSGMSSWTTNSSTIPESTASSGAGTTATTATTVVGEEQDPKTLLGASPSKTQSSTLKPVSESDVNNSISESISYDLDDFEDLTSPRNPVQQQQAQSSSVLAAATGLAPTSAADSVPNTRTSPTTSLSPSIASPSTNENGSQKFKFGVSPANTSDSSKSAEAGRDTILEEISDASSDLSLSLDDEPKTRGVRIATAPAPSSTSALATTIPSASSVMEPAAGPLTIGEGDVNLLASPPHSASLLQANFVLPDRSVVPILPLHQARPAAKSPIALVEDEVSILSARSITPRQPSQSPTGAVSSTMTPPATSTVQRITPQQVAPAPSTPSIVDVRPPQSYGGLASSTPGKLPFAINPRADSDVDLLSPMALDVTTAVTTAKVRVLPTISSSMQPDSAPIRASPLASSMTPPYQAEVIKDELVTSVTPIPTLTTPTATPRDTYSTSTPANTPACSSCKCDC